MKFIYGFILQQRALLSAKSRQIGLPINFVIWHTSCFCMREAIDCTGKVDESKKVRDAKFKSVRQAQTFLGLTLLLIIYST